MSRMDAQMQELFQSVFDAYDWLREHRTPTTIEKVESCAREQLVQNGRLLPDATVGQITSVVNALCGKYNTNTRSSTMSKTREYLTTDGKVVTAQVAARNAQQFAQTQKYYEKPTANLDLATPIPSEPPTTQADANALEAQRRELISAIEAGTLNAKERATAAQRIAKLEEVLARWRNRLMDEQAHPEQVRGR